MESAKLASSAFRGSRAFVLAALASITIAGCENLAGMAIFYANSSTLEWEGTVAGIPFHDKARVEHSGRIVMSIVARADRPEDSYLLTLNSTWDGKSTYITVARGTEFPRVMRGQGEFDFIADMSDGKQHEFDLQKSTAKVAGTLKFRMVR